MTTLITFDKKALEQDFCSNHNCPIAYALREVGVPVSYVVSTGFWCTQCEKNEFSKTMCKVSEFLASTNNCTKDLVKARKKLLGKRFKITYNT